MRTPTRERLQERAHDVDGGYLLAACGLFALKDDGATFSQTETHIHVFSDVWCTYCTLALPAVDWQAAYLIDIINDRVMNDEHIIEVVSEAIERGNKLLLLSGWRLRIYNQHGVTIRTIELDDYSERTVDRVIDLAMPYL